MPTSSWKFRFLGRQFNTGHLNDNLQARVLELLRKSLVHFRVVIIVTIFERARLWLNRLAEYMPLPLRLIINPVVVSTIIRTNLYISHSLGVRWVPVFKISITVLEPVNMFSRATCAWQAGGLLTLHLRVWKTGISYVPRQSFPHN
jgi:hypothetical protein